MIQAAGRLARARGRGPDFVRHSMRFLWQSCAHCRRSARHHRSAAGPLAPHPSGISARRLLLVRQPARC